MLTYIYFILGVSMSAGGPLFSADHPTLEGIQFLLVVVRFSEDFEESGPIGSGIEAGVEHALEVLHRVGLGIAETKGGGDAAGRVVRLCADIGGKGGRLFEARQAAEDLATAIVEEDNAEAARQMREGQRAEVVEETEVADEQEHGLVCAEGMTDGSGEATLDAVRAAVGKDAMLRGGPQAALRMALLLAKWIIQV